MELNEKKMEMFQTKVKIEESVLASIVSLEKCFQSQSADMLNKYLGLVRYRKSGITVEKFPVWMPGNKPLSRRPVKVRCICAMLTAAIIAYDNYTHIDEVTPDLALKLTRRIAAVAKFGPDAYEVAGDSNGYYLRKVKK